MEQSRKLTTKQWLSGQPVTVDLPISTIIKKIQIDLYGSVQATYSSGSPVAYPTNIMDILLPNISVVVDGSRTVKSIRPYMTKLFNFITSKINPIRRATTGSAAYALPKAVTVDAAFIFPTSTQYATFIESMIINFECPSELALNGQATYLNIFGKASAEIRFQCGDFANMEGSGVSVTYANINVYIDTTIVTVDLDPNTKFLDLRETVRKATYTSQVNNSLEDLPKGNKLVALGLLFESNMSNTGSVEAYHALNNIAGGDLKVIVNGTRIEKASDFLRLQNETRSRFGVNSSFASNVSPLDGYCMINFLENRDLASALDLRQEAGVVDAKLDVTTAVARAAAPYLTYPIQLSMHTIEVANAI